MGEITQEMRDRARARKLAREFETLVRNSAFAHFIPGDAIDGNSDEVLKLMVEILKERGRIVQRPDKRWERP
jgi:glycerate-2-kinase